MKSFLALVCIGILLNAPLAQQTGAPPSRESQQDRIALHQALLDLTNPWTVMCIAAHPDDEDGTSLIVMRHKHGAHTVSLFTTFGEGGQNAIGPELYEELGAIRVRETKAASEIQGSEPYFLGLKDFGYSKSADETYRFWGRDESLRRMVLQIRKVRPDVIITNHDTSRGHGHHQATGQLVLEAFDAAADPNRFPEQLKDDVGPWQVQRLFVRGFGTATANAGQKPDRQGGLVLIDPNERDAIRGTTYAEQALQALQKHATQGPWPKTVADMARFRSSPDGKLPLIRYRLAREAKDVAPLPNESHNLLEGLRLSENVPRNLAPPTIDGRPLADFVNERERVLHSLLVTRKGSHEIKVNGEDGPRFQFMKKRLFHALAVASGVAVTITPQDKVLVPGKTTNFVISISNTGSAPAKPYLLAFNGTAAGVGADSPGPLPPGKTITTTRQYRTEANAIVNLPHDQHLYDGRLLGDKISAAAFVQVDGAGFMVPAEISMDVSAPVEITNISPSPLVLTPGTVDAPSTFTVSVVNHLAERFEGTLTFGGPTAMASGARRNSGTSLNYGPGQSMIDFKLAAGETRGLQMKLPGLFELFEFGGRRKHPIPNIVRFTIRNASARVTDKRVHITYADARVAPNLRVGYIRGFDYSLPNALAALGVESKELSIADVRTADLQKYSAIIVDNRVYESQPELITTNQRLLDYAKDGGTLIVFYHKANEWNPNPRVNRPQLAPYPIILNDERVTDENAPMTFIEPQHPLLNSPNKMGQEDFAGWIQERGLYYPKEWDVKYRALLAMNDPGEAPLRGGLLVAEYGRGHYIYTSMVWYRQLRAGVPGAYRMLGNMISYGK